jgi:signal peptidase
VTTGNVRAVVRGLGWAVVFSLALILCAGAILPRLIGAAPLAVLSGSMEPTYSPGDLVIAQPVDVQSLNPGDVITFQPNSGDPALVTHRIIGFSFGDGEISEVITQGDANGASDKPLVPGQVMGKVLYSLPYLGFVSVTLSSFGVAWLLPIIGGIVVLGSVVAFIRIARAPAPRKLEPIS